VREAYQKPIIRALRDGQEQSRFVISQIRRLQSEGYRMDEMVVLYRAHYQAMELQLELAREQVPYAITSGVRFFEQAHVKDVLSVLRILYNPADQLAFVRLMGLLPRVGQKTAQKLWSSLGGRVGTQTEQQRLKLLSVLPKATQAIWKDIDPILKAYHDEKLADDPGEVAHRFIQAFYDAYATATYDNAPRRLEDLQEFILFCSRFENIDAFLNEVSLLTNIDTQAGFEEEQGDKLKLSTVHQAKGLEWKVVFILWMSDGMFPSSRSIDDAGGEQEERRLFYVAATRAKDELYFCSPTMRRNRDGSVAFYNPSRFITELPDDLMIETGASYV
jgi:DNA helicase-2/ATP-dependent DNA helicase PcrA